MRVLVVSWEYPPLVYGGLGRHVHGLAEALAALGHDVVVLTQAHPDAPADSRVGGVRVLRVTGDPPAEPGERTRRNVTGDAFVTWVMALNSAQARAAASLLAAWRPHVVHAHDWVAAHAGIHLARSAGVPLVATMHATEAGLWNGWLSTRLSRARHDVEGWLLAEAARTVVCSEAMRVEVSCAFGVEGDDLEVIPNAVDPAGWQTSAAERTVLRRELGVGDAPLLVLAGRLEWEKGADVAVEALPRVRAHHPGARLVLAGTGGQEPVLRALVRRRRLVRAVHFAGHLDRLRLARLVGTADVALAPSSYEPFGMVALEAAAAGTPVVAGDTGGLREIVVDEVSGLLVAPRSPRALADAVARLLDEPALGEKLVGAARTRLAERHSWPAVARAVAAVYADAMGSPDPPRPRPAPVSDGNVLASKPGSVRRRWGSVRADQ